MAKGIKHFMDEADIGSGEKTPEQLEMEQEQRSLNPAATANTPNDSRQAQAASPPQHADQRLSGEEERLQPSDSDQSVSGRVLRHGSHLARIVALAQPDGTYEAQVYVRLMHEPEVAETYIPAGTFTTEAEAWTAAEERAQRAFKEHEF